MLRRSAARASLAAVLLLGSSSVARAASDGSDDGLSLGLGLYVPYVVGTTRAREHDSRGDVLHFDGDLGIDHAETPSLRISYRFLERNRVFLDFDYWVLRGHVGSLAREVTFNEATLARGTALDARPDLFTVALGYERTVLDLGDRGSLALGLGIHYDWLNFVLNGTLSADTVGHETREDFNSQALPIPWIGASFHYCVTDDLRLHVMARGFRAKGWNSLRTEQGTVYSSQADVDAVAALDYSLTPSFSLDGGVRYRYLAQTETSHEDGNDVAFSAVGPTLGLEYRF